MEKIFAWFKVNYPEYELMYACDSINGSHIFYIRKLTPGALMFKKIISAADIRNSTSPDEFVMNTLKELIESTAYIQINKDRHVLEEKKNEDSQL